MTPPVHTDSGWVPPDDAEMQLLTLYVGGFMTDHDMRSFEDRLVEDIALYRRMAPILRVWDSRAPLPNSTAIAARVELRRADRRRRKRRKTLVIVCGLAAAVALAFGGAVFESRSQWPETPGRN